MQKFPWDLLLKSIQASIYWQVAVYQPMVSQEVGAHDHWPAPFYQMEALRPGEANPEPMFQMPSHLAVSPPPLLQRRKMRDVLRISDSVDLERHLEFPKPSLSFLGSRGPLGPISFIQEAFIIHPLCGESDAATPHLAGLWELGKGFNPPTDSHEAQVPNPVTLLGTCVSDLHPRSWNC